MTDKEKYLNEIGEIIEKHSLYPPRLIIDFLQESCAIIAHQDIYEGHAFLKIIKPADKLEDIESITIIFDEPVAKEFFIKASSFMKKYNKEIKQVFKKDEFKHFSASFLV